MTKPAVIEAITKVANHLMKKEHPDCTPLCPNQVRYVVKAAEELEKRLKEERKS
jgi:hypothetical protein